MIGDGLVLASLVLSATVTVAQGRLLTGRDPVAVTAVQFLGATLGALLVSVLTEGAPALPAGPGPVLAVVALAAGGTLLPFTLFAFGQSRVSAEVAGAFLNLEPLVGAIAGAVAFADPVGLAQIAGGAAIVAGIVLSSLPLFAGRRRSKAAPRRAPAPLRAVSLGNECESLPERVSRVPQPLNPAAQHARRNGVFVGVHAGTFGAGRPGGARPGTGARRAGRRGDRGVAARSRPSGRAARRPSGPAAGRPPARRRPPSPRATAPTLPSAAGAAASQPQPSTGLALAA